MAQLEKSLSNFFNLQPFSPSSLIVKDNRDKFHDCDLARQYVAWVYFSISIGKYEKKGIKFPDSSVLSFILFFKKSEISQIFR